MNDDRLRIAGLALSLCGVALAGYLAWVHYADAQTVCVGGGGSCERVQESEYAVFLGIPVAVIGMAGYLALASAFAIRHDEARTAAAFMSIAGVGFSAYLTFIEVFTLEATCQWCVASAVLMTAIAAIAGARVLRASPTERRLQT
jgi:uncharacterized membrane protein